MNLGDAALAAFITGSFGIVIAFINRLRKENKEDHGQNVSILNRIEGKIDTHIRDHATGKFD